MKLLLSKFFALSFLLLLVFFQTAAMNKVYAGSNSEDRSSELEIMTTFTADERAQAEKGVVKDEVKHKILFWMGIALLVMIIATAAVGINMAFFGKEIFVAHMVLAGGAVFLSIAHAVTAIVWFFPF